MGGFCAQVLVRNRQFVGSVIRRLVFWSLLVSVSFHPSLAWSTDTPPTLAFHSEHPGGSQWELVGNVGDENPGGLTVTFSGLVTGTATTESDGSFSYSFTLPPMTSGTVYAEVKDSLGQSGYAQLVIVNY